MYIITGGKYGDYSLKERKRKNSLTLMVLWKLFDITDENITFELLMLWLAHSIFNFKEDVNTISINILML